MSSVKTKAALVELNAALAVVAEADNWAMSGDPDVLHSRQAMNDEQFNRMCKHINQAMTLLTPVTTRRIEYRTPRFDRDGYNEDDGDSYDWYTGGEADLMACASGPFEFWLVPKRLEYFWLVLSNKPEGGYRIINQGEHGSLDLNLIREVEDIGPGMDAETTFYGELERWLWARMKKHPDVRQWYLALEY